MEVCVLGAKGTGIFTALNKKGNFGLHLFYHKVKCKI